MQRIRIELDRGRSYPVLIGRDTLSVLPEQIRKLGLGESIFIVTDSRVKALYGRKVREILKRGGFDDVALTDFPAGEKSKNWRTYLALLRKLAAFAAGKNKKLLLVNLGGGVVGDMGGFAAATFKRGIDFVQVPTTLLANVDSGVGGKVGIDFERVKNLVGSFYQPKMVLVDLKLLDTLDRREIRSGLAEVVKYGVIKDAGLFAYLEKHCREATDLVPSVVEKIVTRSYRIKAGIVEQDERDTAGIRIVLNYGHTIGHAVEAASNYRYSHGEAVSIGMVCSGDLACELGLFPRPTAVRVEKLLSGIGLPVRIAGVPRERILHFLKFDKKAAAGTNRFILARALGRVVVRKGVAPELIRRVIQQRMTPSGR